LVKFCVTLKIIFFFWYFGKIFLNKKKIWREKIIILSKKNNLKLCRFEQFYFEWNVEILIKFYSEDWLIYFLRKVWNFLFLTHPSLLINHRCFTDVNSNFVKIWRSKEKCTSVQLHFQQCNKQKIKIQPIPIPKY
jgi:hypothetical protein